MRSTATTIIIAAGTAIFAANANGAKADSDKPPEVTVCLGGNADAAAYTSYFAEDTASEIFSSIGVRLRWHTTGFCSASTDQIRINYAKNAPEWAPASALAYAYPYEGTHIVVIYGRVKRFSCGCANDPALGYVLAHEIAHILQGILRHSDTGIMKANWDHADYEKMLRYYLRFTPEDIELIHLGLKVRAASAARVSPQLAGR
jgi:hypothetical protein